METQLAIKTKVQPKPTRAEIIDALTQLEIERRKSEEAKQIERRSELQKQIDAKIAAYFSKLKQKPEADVHFGWCSQGKVSHVSIKFDLLNLPEDLQNMLVEWHGLPSRKSDFTFARVRREVLQAASGLNESNRVSRLLENAETRKSLVSTLDALNGK